jgi:hypothetical protein
MPFPPLLTFPFLPPRAPSIYRLRCHLPRCSARSSITFQGPYTPPSSSCSVCISQLWCLLASQFPIRVPALALAVPTAVLGYRSPSICPASFADPITLGYEALCSVTVAGQKQSLAFPFVIPYPFTFLHRHQIAFRPTLGTSSTDMPPCSSSRSCLRPLP